MTEATCAVLTAIFPLILVTNTLERRSIHMNLRQLRFFRIASLATLSACLVGLVVTVLGVQFHGLGFQSAWVGWGAAVVAGAGLAITFMASMATIEGEEDALAAG